MVWFFHDGSGGWIRFENKLSLSNLVFKGSLIPTIAASIPEAMAELADLCKAEGVLDAVPLTRPMSFTVLVKHLESLNLLTPITPTPLRSNRGPRMATSATPPGPRVTFGPPSNHLSATPRRPPPPPAFDPVSPVSTGVSASPPAPPIMANPEQDAVAPGVGVPPPDQLDDAVAESQLVAAHRAEVLLFFLKLLS